MIKDKKGRPKNINSDSIMVSIAWVKKNIIGKLEEPTEYANKDYRWIVIGRNRLRSDQDKVIRKLLLSLPDQDLPNKQSK